MVLPASSGCLAKRTATANAAPPEIPAMMPSSLAKRRAYSIASSFVTCSTLSTSDIKPLLQAAASAGLIPEPAVKLAEAVWTKLATRHDGPETVPSDGQDAPGTTGPELRLPVTFREGKIYLGPLPLGPAPLFPR